MNHNTAHRRCILANWIAAAAAAATGLAASILSTYCQSIPLAIAALICLRAAAMNVSAVYMHKTMLTPPE